jgi:hypothetical protein
MLSQDEEARARLLQLGAGLFEKSCELILELQLGFQLLLDRYEYVKQQMRPS